MTTVSDTYRTIAQALAKPFSIRELSWRVGSVAKNTGRGQALPYIDARMVQDRLDDVLGIDAWHDSYIEVLSSGSIISVRCRLSVRLGDCWITKEDAAQLDNIQDASRAEIAIKGAYSDALKRAAVKFGVGRYLYSFDAPWVALENDKYLPRGFDGLAFLTEAMVPPEEHELLRNAHEALADAVVAAPVAESKRSPPPASATKPAAPAKPAASTQAASQNVQSAQALADDESFVASLREKITKGASLPMLLTYVQGPKAAGRLTASTRDALVAEIRSKMTSSTA